MRRRNRRQTARPLQWNRVLGKNVQKTTPRDTKKASRGAKKRENTSNGKVTAKKDVARIVVSKKRPFFTCVFQGTPKTPLFYHFYTPKKIKIKKNKKK
jgi:hypothetical protein